MICIGWKDDRDEAELRSEPRLLLILGDCLTVCDSVRLQNNVGILYALSVSIIIIFRSRRLTPEFGHELIVCIVLPEPFIGLQLLAPKVDKVIVELFLSGRCVFVWHLVLCGSINAPYELSIPECLVEVDVVTTVRISHSWRCLLEGGLEDNRAKFNRNVESFMLSDRRVNIVEHKVIAVSGRQRALADNLGQNHSQRNHSSFMHRPCGMYHICAHALFGQSHRLRFGMALPVVQNSSRTFSTCHIYAIREWVAWWLASTELRFIGG